MGEIKHSIAKGDQQLFVLAVERPRQRLVAGLSDDSLPHPLPELRLRRPELLAVTTDDKRRLLLFLLCLGQNKRPPTSIYAVLHPSPALSCWPGRQKSHAIPRREASDARGNFSNVPSNR